MTRTLVGKEVEKSMDPEVRKLFNEFIDEKYLLEIVGPGTRTDADYCAQVNLWRKKGRLNKREVIFEEIPGYVKVEISPLESLEVPKFFLKMGRLVKKKIKTIES